MSGVDDAKIERQFDYLQRYANEGHERPNIRARIASYLDFLASSPREKDE